ncbi:MAG TPA: TraR/DksA C4-type zinc finger protein [Myxococcaceae bacterium]|jgi:DnaK suppressor protein|nr:TraR/DksA C4-type zinc finger protein [Myxococcaceae bacterium]
MTETEHRQIRRLLLALRRELEGKGRVKIEPNGGDQRDVGADEDEQPLNEMLQSIASNRNRSHDDLLQRVERALRRLEEDPDDFGRCQECGDDIPFRRMKAMPYAELCTECQSGHDGPRGAPTRRKVTDFR